jgi:hypothetical protein
VVAYRIYFLDGVNRFSRAENVEAKSAEDAVRRAHELRGGAINCEIWCGSRLVARVTADDWPE